MRILFLGVDEQVMDQMPVRLSLDFFVGLHHPCEPAIKPTKLSNHLGLQPTQVLLLGARSLEKGGSNFFFASSIPVDTLQNLFNPLLDHVQVGSTTPRDRTDSHKTSSCVVPLPGVAPPQPVVAPQGHEQR
jgi:hypothetical protein